MFRLLYKIIEVFRLFQPRSLLQFPGIEDLGDPLLSDHPERIIGVILPFKNKARMTIACLEKLVKQTTPMHLILIDNDSSPEQLALIQDYLKDFSSPYKLLAFKDKFNFSKICNRGVSALPPSVDTLLFLNNDVELRNPSTLKSCSDVLWSVDDVGCIGLKLLYPNGRLQHLFALPGCKVIASHPYKGAEPNQSSLFNAVLKVPAVTGAYIMMKSEVFTKVGGFDETLGSAGQDIDLCLKARALGYSIISMAKLSGIHYESYSRRNNKLNPEEITYFYTKWLSYLRQNSFIPKNHSNWTETPCYNFGGGSYPWERVINL